MKCFEKIITPCGLCVMGAAQSCGLIDFDGGSLKLGNPFHGCSFPGCMRTCTQVALAPGCVVPGRSLIALFVNTAALLWFFLYLGFTLWDSWEVTCSRYNQGIDPHFQNDVWGWLMAGAPSPIHWLLLIFAVTGTTVVIFSFISDMFSGPKPPPRSYYEATLWRGKRQLKVIGYVVLLCLFLGWGFLLTYYTFTDDGCANQGGDRRLLSLYNVAMLLVLLLLVVFFLVVTLGCCVLLDCFLSGRVRMVLLLRDPEPPLPPPPEQYSNGDNDERLVPGVPPRDGTVGQYGTTSSSAFLVGACEDGGSRLCTASDVPTAAWASPGAKLPKAR